MKLEDIARPGAVMLGVAGLAAGALLGFAAGVAVMRDPDAARRTAARAARLASQGFEQVTLLAAQAREQLGDMWAEAEAATAHARATADEADFAREAAATAAGAATSATAATTAAGAADSPSEQGSASGKRAAGAASPRKRAPRKKAAAKRGETPAGPEASSAGSARGATGGAARRSCRHTAGCGPGRPRACTIVGMDAQGWHGADVRPRRPCRLRSPPHMQPGSPAARRAWPPRPR